MVRSRTLASGVLVALTTAAGCQKSSETTDSSAAAKETAEQFVERTNKEMTDIGRESSAAAWAYATYINQDTEFLNAKANERWLTYFSKAVEDAKTYDNQQLAAPVARS